MTEQDVEARIGEIGRCLDSLQGAWPFLSAELTKRAEELTESLVNTNNDETRGRIKALRDVLNLPQTLASEREGLSAGLADNAPAD